MEKLSKFQTRFEEIVKLKPLQIAMILDPRQKLRLVDKKEKENLRQMVIAEMKNLKDVNPTETERSDGLQASDHTEGGSRLHLS